MSQIIYRLLVVMGLSRFTLIDSAGCLEATAERIRYCLEHNKIACLRTYHCEDIANQTESSCCQEDERLVLDKHSEVGHCRVMQQERLLRILRLK